MTYALRIKFEAGTPPASYLLTADCGTYALSGRSAGLSRTYYPATGLPAWVPAMDALAAISTNTLSSVAAAGGSHTGNGFQTMVTGWSSGTFATEYGQLGAYVIAGGGDGDYHGNEVYVFPLETRAWERKGSPSAINIATANTEYGEWADGKPGTPHTYGASLYMPPSMGGGSYGSLLWPVKAYWYLGINSTGHGHKFDLQTATWTRATSSPMSTSELVSSWAYDPARARFVGTVSGSGLAYTTNLRTLANWAGGVAAHSTEGSSHYGLGNYATGEVIPSIDAFVQLGTTTTGTVVLRGYDLTAAGTYYTLTVSCDALPPGAGNGMAYVPGNNALYILSTTAGQQQYIWKVTHPTSGWQTGTWTCQRITMAGVTISESPTVQGMWQRLRYAPAVGCLIWCHSVTTPVYAYRVYTPASTLTKTMTTVALNGNATAIATPGSKHLNFAYASGRWWKMCGDHVRDDVESPTSQDGRQEIYSFTVGANDWRRDQRYYIYDPAQVQMFQPDDAFCVSVSDTEIVVFRSTGVLNAPVYPLPGATAPAATQVHNAIMKYDTSTLRWSVLRYSGTTPPPVNPGDEYNTGRAWYATYDAPTGRILVPCDASGLKVQEIRASDGLDISPRTASGVLYNRTFRYLLGWAHDPDSRYAYAACWQRGELYRINLDSLSDIVLLMTLPNETYAATPRTRRMKHIWHPGLRAVIIAGNQWNVYEVATQRLTQFERDDYFTGREGNRVYTSDCFYDAPSGKVISIGGIDWNGGTAPNRYYVHDFRRA